MAYVQLEDIRLVRTARDTSNPAIYVIDSIEHPMSIAYADGLSSSVVAIPVRRWNDALTPWVAPGLYRGEPDFGGKANSTLAELLDEALPRADKAFGVEPRARAICGYSLGGLFSLYAFTHSDAFCACGCLSGSVWYEGWVDYLRKLDKDLTGSYAYLSIGTKEKRAARPILHGVQQNMEECAHILAQQGCQVCYRTGPGNHMQHVPERFAAGLGAIDRFLMESGVPCQHPTHS